MTGFLTSIGDGGQIHKIQSPIGSTQGQESLSK